MAAKEEELEFMTIHQEEDDGNMTSQSYAAADDSAGADSVVGNWLFKQAKHPMTIFFHLLFKSLAVFLYIFGSWFTSNFIFIFVLCIILLAFDFWTVKNISGRLLVGLRWWSVVQEDGSNEWIFESLEDASELCPNDSRFFWGGLYITPVVWSLLLFVGILRLKFEYMPIIIAAISMSMANIVGYMKCSSSAKDKMRNLVEQGMKQNPLAAALDNSSVRNWIFSTLLDASSKSSNSTTTVV